MKASVEYAYIFNDKDDDNHCQSSPGRPCSFQIDASMMQAGACEIQGRDDRAGMHGTAVSWSSKGVRRIG
jgi:hypothetical protein